MSKLKSSNSRRNSKLEAEEKELEELMKEARGETSEEVQEVEEEEEEETPEVKTEEKEVKSEETPKEEDEELSAEEKNWKKRYGDLRSHSQAETNSLKARIEELEKQNSGEMKPPATEEELKAWAEQYPDAARIIETMVETKASEKLSSVQSEFASLSDVEKELNRSKAEAKIAQSHPDYISLRENDDFHKWAAKQPDFVQAALYEREDDPESVIWVLDNYKKDTGQTPSDKKKQKKQNEADAAKAVSNSSKPSVKDDATDVKWSESKVASLSDAAYMEYAEEIDEAIASGNFLYDMSKKA